MPANRIVPAQEGFCAGNFSGRQPYLGLVIQLEFPALQSAAQAGFERALLNGAGAHFLREDLGVVASGIFSVIQRDVRMPDEGFRVDAIIRVHADADTGRHVNFVRCDLMRSSERSKYLLGDAAGIADMFDFRK